MGFAESIKLNKCISTKDAMHLWVSKKIPEKRGGQWFRENHQHKRCSASLGI